MVVSFGAGTLSLDERNRHSKVSLQTRRLEK